ncbi:MAG: ribosomal RNA small subunit methyltransferase A [Bacteroidetes bacterium]|nr:ribosomal RNA small subunit methyltransferase A [Bacteroidota bacterium]
MYTLKKSLGQHFLHDENICRKIVSVLQERPVAQLLEVGPGGGALTKYLLDWKGIDLQAVEVDAEKVDYLIKTYPALTGHLIHKSFLEIDAPFSGSFTVVGNFPYNISSQILFQLLDWRTQVECAVGMFQKEVAERVAAPSGNKVYGVISVLIQTFFTVEYLFDVSESSFNPPPNVKSGVIRLLPRTDVPVFASEKKLFLLVKTAFNQRRKMLRNAVRGLFAPETLSDPIFDLRAEALTVEQFSELTFRMS